jgi:predicted dienelactone hydrolase
MNNVKGQKMPSRKKLGSAVLILVVISVLFMGARAKQKYEEKSADSLPEAPQYSVKGPYSMGMSDFSIGSETPLEITVWYPAENNDLDEEGTTYPYEIKLGDPFGTVALASYNGQAMRDAPFDFSASPYPLVILSPGFSIGSSAYAWLAEHLASYGFVVISPEHHEHLDPENELWRAAITRPQDILTVLANIDEQVGPAGAFPGWVNKDFVAVIGHSYGGYTALAAAGAQINTNGFEDYCKNAQEGNDPGAWLCDQLLPHMPDMAGLSGLDSIPEGLWPVWADPRVDAIVSMAGDALFFSQAGLAKIAVPVMAIGGTADSDSPFLWGTYPTFEYVSSPRKVKIALNDAEHMIFTGSCEAIPWYLKFFSGEFCSDMDWDREYAHDLVNHFTTAFLLAELNQDVNAAAVLVPDAVDSSGVTYEAQGY